MIKITLEFESYAEAATALQDIGLGARGLAPEKRAPAPVAADVPKPPTKPAAAGQPAAAKPTPAPAPAASSPAPAASAEVTPEQLTKAIVSAVTRAGRDKVVAHLKDEYGVSKGAEITDPEIRATALATVNAL